MAKGPNQKLKLLYLMRYLLQNSDEAHPVSIAQMIAELEKHGISAERKSIYDDLEALRTFGLDLVQIKGRTTGYYIGQRDFELPELKLLVDSVQSSKFITQGKTLQLIKKIESLASSFDAQLLQRQVYVRNRVKSMNESVYYNVDEISTAITRDRKIRFQYFEYTVSKERRFRRGGARDEDAGKLKHYRVDKMARISALEDRRQGKEAFVGVDMSAYSQKVFGMFGGQAQTVRLRFASHLAGAVIDRFGREVMMIADGEEQFTVSLEVVVSPQFFAWVFGFGTEAEILSPEAVRSEAGTIAQNIAELYR